METTVDTTITWVIKNFSSLQSAPIYSDIFVVGGCKWQVDRLFLFVLTNGLLAQ